MNVLVQLTAYYQKTGSYSGSKPAYANYLQVRILDMPSKRLIAEKTLIYSPPYSIPATDSEGRGYVGDSAALEFILETCGQ